MSTFNAPGLSDDECKDMVFALLRIKDACKLLRKQGDNAIKHRLMEEALELMIACVSGDLTEMVSEAMDVAGFIELLSTRSGRSFFGAPSTPIVKGLNNWVRAKTSRIYVTPEGTFRTQAHDLMNLVRFVESVVACIHVDSQP